MKYIATIKPFLLMELIGWRGDDILVEVNKFRFWYEPAVQYEYCGLNSIDLFFWYNYDQLHPPFFSKSYNIVVHATESQYFKKFKYISRKSKYVPQKPKNVAKKSAPAPKKIKYN